MSCGIKRKQKISLGKCNHDGAVPPKLQRPRCFPLLRPSRSCTPQKFISAKRREDRAVIGCVQGCNPLPKRVFFSMPQRQKDRVISFGQRNHFEHTPLHRRATWVILCLYVSKEVGVM